MSFPGLALTSPELPTTPSSPSIATTEAMYLPRQCQKTGGACILESLLGAKLPRIGDQPAPNWPGARNQTEPLDIFVTAVEPIPSWLIHRGSVTYHSLIGSSRWSQDSDTTVGDLPHFPLRLSYFPVFVPKLWSWCKICGLKKKERQGLL